MSSEHAISDSVVCPYCRMPFAEDGPPRLFCTSCGTPHHEDCYQENGGCTVFGCPKAPADDPKLQVSAQDLNMAPMMGQSMGQYGQYNPYANPNAQNPYAVAGTPSSRTTFVVLGIFLGMFGAHNFYAGYTGKAVGQLCLTILSCGYLFVVAWIWAIVEICIVDRDKAGIHFS
jgi:TM2 domain-containing membrane protein YozV